MRTAGGRAVAGRAHVHEQQRILLAHWIGAENLRKEFIGVVELRSEFIAKLLVHFVAAGVNAWTNGGANVCGVAGKFASHDANSLLHDARQRAAPSGMERAHRSLACVSYEHRQA